MSFNLSIHGVRVSVTSNNRSLDQFLRSYFNGFVEDDATFQDPHIKVSITMEPGFSFKTSVSHIAPEILGSRLGWDAQSNTLTWEKGGIRAEKIFASPIKISASFKKNLFKHVANLIFFAGNKTQENYYRSIARDIIQQAAFLALIETKKITILSAAAVNIEGQGILFAGLPGSGKSTIVNNLVKDMGAAILAENYVLTDGKMLFPFPEGKSTQTEAVPIKQIYVISHGSVAVDKSIPKEVAEQAIRSINTLTAELPHQSQYATLALVDPDRWARIEKTESETLKNLCESTPCYRLVVSTAEKSVKDLLSL